MCLRLSYLRSSDSCGHSPSECGLAWSAIEEAVHRSGHLGIQLPISILPPWTLVGISHLLLTAIALFSFSRGGAEATYSPFHNWTVSSVGTWSQSGAWHWFFSWGFVAVSGTLWFARLQKGRTIHELVLKKQPGCLIPRVSASE